MIFVRKTFDFIGRHLALLIPLLLLNLVPQAAAYLASGYFPADAASRLAAAVVSGVDFNKAADAILSGIGSVVADGFPRFGLMLAVFAATSLVLKVFVDSGTYAAISRGLDGGPLLIREALPLYVRDAGRYAVYLLCLLLYWFFWAFAAAMVLLMASVFALMIQPIQVVLMLLVVILLAGAFVYLGLVITLWYPAMSHERLSVEAALRKGIKVTRRFLPLIVLVYLAVGAVSALILWAVRAAAPSSALAASAAYAVVWVLAAFFVMVFQIVIYKTYVDVEKTAYQRMIAEEEAEKARTKGTEGDQP